MSSSSFHSTRLSIRAVLVSALLVLGHVLLTTLSNSPLAMPHPLLGDSIKTTSALIFLTLLWVSFTLLEAVDVHVIQVPARLARAEELEAERLLVFDRTWVELLLNSMILGSWAAWAREAVVVIQTFTPSISVELAIIPVSYAIALLCLTFLQAQIVFSMLHHLVLHGLTPFASWSFWNAKTGHWTHRILLDTETAVAYQSEKIWSERN